MGIRMGQEGRSPFVFLDLILVPVCRIFKGEQDRKQTLTRDYCSSHADMAMSGNLALSG